MSKKIVLTVLILVSLVLTSSCSLGGSRIEMLNNSEDKRADARMEQIISALKETDKEALKVLFSKKALDEANDFDGEVNSLFELVQGKIESWERGGFASGASMGGGKKSWMIRFGFDVKTDESSYHFFVIDYNIDTISPDNQGVYMLELIENYGEVELESWQDRMRAGIYIH